MLIFQFVSFSVCFLPALSPIYYAAMRTVAKNVDELQTTAADHQEATSDQV